MAYLIHALAEHPSNFTADQQREAITYHYSDIARKVQAFADGTLPQRGLIINGPCGGGKTEVVRQTLNALRSRYHMINGSMSAPQWHCKLHEYARLPNQILVMDDTDIIFNDVQMCDTTKAALDNSPGKTVDYIKTNSAALRIAQVPDRFQCQGRVIFITNRAMTEQHMTVKDWSRIKPIKDRCHYVTAGLSPAWTGIAMRMMLESNHIRELTNARWQDIDQQHKRDIVMWISQNVEHFSYLSFRSIEKALGYFKMDSLRWQDHLLADTGE